MSLRSVCTTYLASACKWKGAKEEKRKRRQEKLRVLFLNVWRDGHAIYSYLITVHYIWAQILCTSGICTMNVTTTNNVPMDYPLSQGIWIAIKFILSK